MHHLAEILARLTEVFSRELEADTPSEDALFKRILDVLQDMVPEAQALSVRLIDEDTRELRYSAIAGTAWQADERLRREAFSVDEDPPRSAGAHVVQTGRVLTFSDVLNARDFLYAETFSETRQMTIAPISLAGKIFGVLDIRALERGVLPENTSEVAGILSSQLGLYLWILRSFNELKAIPALLSRTYEDFSHQLRSPVLQLRRRAEELAAGHHAKQNAEPSVSRKILQIRALAGKVQATTEKLRLFSDLASEKPIKLRLRRVTADSLVPKIIGLVDDYQALTPRKRFTLDRASVRSLASASVYVDTDLLIQALGCLLDNAAKYSFEGSHIKVQCGRTKRGYVRFLVKNTGIGFPKSEVRKALERGYRGREAQLVTGEGEGIGLWLANQIMIGMKGNLSVWPTDANGETRVSLVLPVEHEPKQQEEDAN